MDKIYDFIFGVQYYRAPTPARDNWEADLKNIKDTGFNCVKFWVQWRWTHRGENTFYYDDIDILMDLAAKYGLKATLNIIFDVVPVWFINKYPDSKIVLANGHVVEPHTEGHRQIGGFPGTCYNHYEAFNERMRFLRATVDRYKDHPALHMWDVWNEPEQCGPNRYPIEKEIPCYCENCKKQFKRYLKNKYLNIDRLNDIWGRCYFDFDEIELPVNKNTYGDYIDFREYHLDTMTREANCRLNTVREIDKSHPVYLHVVPNTSSIFNSITGVDDFALAENCDLFASTNFSMPIWSILTTSASRGKFCFNAECHIGSGTTAMHQRQLEYKELLRELVPQIGMGLRGFMFWQYRPEVLGIESPAWGTTNIDGSIGSIGIAAKKFSQRIMTYADEIVNCSPQKSQVAIWKSRTNEIFSYCMHNNLSGFAKSIESYVNCLYYNNYSCKIVDDNGLKNDLEGVKLLIMPYCYAVDSDVIKSVSKFVADGGTLLCEAHFGGYNIDTNRHSFRMPGFGLDKKWNILEEYTTSSYHLKDTTYQSSIEESSLTEDTKKAVKAQGISGGKCFPISTKCGCIVMGAERFTRIKAEGGDVIGTFNGEPVIVAQKYDKGKIIYCGTNLGEGKEFDVDGFDQFIVNICKEADVETNPFYNGNGVHTNKLSDNMYAVTNTKDYEVSITLDGEYKAIFTDTQTENCVYTIPANTADILVKK